MFNFLKFSLASVLTLGLFSVPTFAQEDGEEVEEVIVTGSRIARTEFDGINPLLLLAQKTLKHQVS